MKFLLCKSFETSDEEDDEEEVEEEEENVSVADQKEELNASEDEEESAGSSQEYDASSDDADPDEAHSKDTSPIKKANEVKLNGKSSGEIIKANTESSENSSESESDTEITVKAVKGKTEIVKKEEPQTKFNGAKPLGNTNSTATIRAPARNKNVSTETMVMAAIRSLNERGGSSAIAIKKYIMSNYPKEDGQRMLILIKQFVKKALLSGKLVQSKGTGLGGSFKISPEQNKLEKKKVGEKGKKSKQKSKKDAPADKADLKTKPATKAKTKKPDKSEPKTATDKKISKTKTTTASTIKVSNGAASQKVPKSSAALKKVPKTVVESNQPKKVATKNVRSAPIEPVVSKPTRNIKVASSATTMKTAEKPKKVSPVKSASVADVSASPIKTGPKAKSTPLPKKKPAVKAAKPAVPDIDEITEDGGGDADTVKHAAKKVAAKKGKSK